MSHMVMLLVCTDFTGLFHNTLLTGSNIQGKFCYMSRETINSDFKGAIPSGNTQGLLDKIVQKVY